MTVSDYDRRVRDPSANASRMADPNRQRHPIALGFSTPRVVGNPLRRGPVVLATDGTSDLGAPVLAAHLIATRLGLPLEVITVLDRSPATIIAPDSMPEELRRNARETSVRDYVARFLGGATPPPIHVRFGRLATDVARFARDMSATIVVMGSAPQHRFRHVVSGQRAAQVLHTATCPVLSIPPTFSALPRIIVAAVDFGPSSLRAAQAALLVADEGATVFLTHVLAPPVRIPALSMVSETDVLINTHALFDLLLEDIAASIPDGVEVKPLVVSDDTVGGILSAAADVKADLIAVGTQGPGPLARLFVGSVTETILHTSEQTVLACPPLRRSDADAFRPDDDPPDADHAWPAALDAFTERNIGRVATLEILDPNVGPHVTGHGYTFLGATYEPKTHRVTVMVGDADRPTQHLTRSVPYPDAITIRPALFGDGEVLDIQHGQGHTIVTVASADTEGPVGNTRSRPGSTSAGRPDPVA